MYIYGKKSRFTNKINLRIKGKGYRKKKSSTISPINAFNDASRIFIPGLCWWYLFL